MRTIRNITSNMGFTLILRNNQKPPRNLHTPSPPPLEENGIRNFLVKIEITINFTERMVVNNNQEWKSLETP
jgi:hypothetical protein